MAASGAAAAGPSAAAATPPAVAAEAPSTAAAEGVPGHVDGEGGVESGGGGVRPLPSFRGTGTGKLICFWHLLVTCELPSHNSSSANGYVKKV